MGAVRQAVVECKDSVYCRIEAMRRQWIPLTVLLFCCFCLGLGACAVATGSRPTAAAQKASLRRLTATPPTLTTTPTASPTPYPTSTPVPRHTFATKPAPADPLQPYYVDSLRTRPYTSGDIAIVAPLGRNSAFTSYMITYASDGLRITGLMNVPSGEGPFPVIILNHGYYDPASYVSGEGTQFFADAFARQGYLTLAPDYRIYGGSDKGPDPYRTGFAVDLVNLIVSVKSLPQARPDDIGLWGHSMGGGIALEALVINPPGLRAAALLAPMSGDIAENYSAIVAARGSAPLGPDWAIAPQDNPNAYKQLSPINYLKYVSVPVQIHHGQSDPVVPPAWSVRLAQALTDAGKDAVFYLYPGAGHSFYDGTWNLCLARNLEFFNSILKTP
jgi:uncharacterized protein